MQYTDLVVFVIYLLTLVVVGARFVKSASNSTADYFIAGRKLSWFMAGTSMVATTFSADTPLFVAGMTRTTGIFSNWFWWCLAIGQIASVFFFARLWRRTEVLTDIEFLTLRYKPSTANNILRISKVLYDGVMINCITMAVVLLSITKIIKTLVPYNDVVLTTLPLLGEVDTTMAIMFGLALFPLAFTALVGLHGVVSAEVVQFVMAMTGSVILAVIVYIELSSSGTGSTYENLKMSPEFKDGLLNIIPSFEKFDLYAAGFLINILIGWWAFAPSNGYFVQRMLASRSEKDSLFGLLWFNFAHYVLRPWPWIIVGLASLYFFPNIADPEAAYPMMVNKFLPAGLKGLMVASLFAAFMSTSDTHLNWGTSYIINDLYQPFFKPGKIASHYINMGKWVMACLTCITLVIATKLTGILSTFQFLYNIWGGISLVMILRWYWWRVNVYSEISAMVSSLVMTIVLELLPATEGADMYPVRLLINTAVTSVIWISVTFYTTQKPDETTLNFYKKLRVSGPGWKPVALLTGIKPLQGEFKQNFLATITCLIFLYSLLMFIGNMVLQNYLTGLMMLAITVASALGLGNVMKRMHFD